MIRIKHLFYAASLAAASVYLFGIAGLLLAGLISGGWGYVFFVTPKPRGSAGCCNACQMFSAVDINVQATNIRPAIALSSVSELASLLTAFVACKILPIGPATR